MTNYNFQIKIGPHKAVLAVAAIIVLPFVISNAGISSTHKLLTSHKAHKPSHSVAKTIDANTPKLVKKTVGDGYALAPDDWTIQSNPQGSAIDLTSSDHAMGASWGAVSINPLMERYYGPMYSRDPAASILAIINIALGTKGDGNAQYTSQPEPFAGFFTRQEFESNDNKGVVFYHVYPTSHGTYVESMYVASTEKGRWEKDGYIAVNVALSIRGSAKFIPPAPSSGGSHGAKAKSREATAANAYNKELGVKYVHSPTTGENFLVDPSTSTWETGPDGPGIYRPIGTNQYEKLEIGRSDD